MKNVYIFSIFCLMALCHLVKAEVPLDAQPCPGCLVELPAIEVSETAMPTKVAYRNLLNGMDAFNEHRAYAPRAELRFLVQSQNPGKVLSGLTASIAGAELDMPLQIDKDGIFELPRLEGTTAKDSSVIVNRREGSIRLRPYVRSQNTTPERRRMGDLRLECEIIWSIERDNLSFLARSALKLVGGLCGSSKSKVSFRVVNKLLGANLLFGDRKLAVPIDKTGYAYSPPLYDRSWPDDAVIELEFEKG